jgi:hypothetical protein
VQDQFASETQPTVWQVLPVFEFFHSRWKCMALSPRYQSIKSALCAGTDVIAKYYNLTGNSSAARD